MSDDLCDRMAQGVERVHERLRRACVALGSAHISYAVIGGHAAAAWIATVDETAVRNSQKIEILLRRRDFEAATAALQSVGFVQHENGVFLDGLHAGRRNAVRIVFANEQRSTGNQFLTPDVIESRTLSIAGAEFSVVELELLVRMNLDSFTLDNRVDLEDLIEVGLLNDSWRGRLNLPLAARLQEVLAEVERNRHWV